MKKLCYECEPTLEDVWKVCVNGLPLSSLHTKSHAEHIKFTIDVGENATDTYETQSTFDDYTGRRDKTIFIKKKKESSISIRAATPEEAMVLFENLIESVVQPSSPE